MAPAAEALRSLAAELRIDGSVIAAHVVDPGDAGAELGELAASGPRTAAGPGEYAIVIEAVREGYLLHYGNPRIVGPGDPDLALLAGDYLYALGIERLAALGDLEAVRELGDLISLAAQLHAAESEPAAVGALWLGSVAAIAFGASAAHREAKDALRQGRPEAARGLGEAALEAARRAGRGVVVDRAAQAIDFGGRSG